ncbi:MAG: DUF1311 domain-containing protein [Gammaproteobacteria bacterium]|nr:MAG: DUF1311 domain-containing protein [Gammaproteobacteria bacterium]
MFKLIINASLCVICISTQAASFDCNAAKSNVEKSICSNAEVSRADENLSKSYSEVKRKAQRPDLLTNNQLEWLKQRNNCKDESCLLKEYNSRIESVAGWLDYENKTYPKAGGEVQCTDKPECWPEGSAMNTGLTLVASLEKKSAQLESKHNELTALLSASPSYNGEKNPDSRVISALNALKISWIKYRSDECELIGSLTGAGGSWPSTYANRCEVNLTEERLNRISSSIKCIQKIPLEKRWMEQANCLQQLAPLANKL